jgi:outer membrane protein assembly factor BamB
MKFANFAFLLLASAFTFDAPAFDWPQWRGPNRDGHSKETGWQSSWPENGPRRIWEAPVGVGYSSVSVSRGRVFTMGNGEDKDAVHCFDAETGKVLWKHEYPCEAKDPNGFPGPRCTPTVDGDLVYSLSRHGDLFCLEAKTGKVRWSKNLVKDLGGREPMHGENASRQGWGYSGSPLIEKGWLLIEAGGKGASVVALDKLTGALVWKTGDDGAGYSSLIATDLQGERAFVQFSDNNIIGRRMKDGSELWRQVWKTSYGVNAATPILSDGEVFVSSGYGSGCAKYKIGPAALTEVWRNKNMRNHVNSCVLVNGFLYGFDEGELKCLDWKTGEVKWSEKSYGKGALMYADGKLILYSQSGKLGIAEATPESFKQLASVQALKGNNTWAPPVLANGRIYVRSLDSLAAFDVSSPKP